MPAETLSLELDSLRSDQISQINGLVDRFEADLHAGFEPSPDSFVAELEDPHARLVLVRLLTQTEMEKGLSAERSVASSPDDGVGAPAPPSYAEGGEFDAARGIPDFELVSEIGRGGMGRVYLARQRSLGRLVALKRIELGALNSPELRKRFRREAEAAAKCQHPNLVQTFQVGEHGSCLYLAMEYVDGGSLQRLFTGKPQDARGAAERIETLARAIDLAHRSGVVHRDLKPMNILLTKEGQPKVADFGLAKLIDSPHSITEEGTLAGTPDYMAPEQASGRTSLVGPATDIHALGAILYEALTGRPPFRGASSQETLRKIVEEVAPPPSPLAPRRSIPQDLESICLKCLQKDPKDRYATAADLADDLRRFLEGKSTLARPVKWPVRFWQWCRRKPYIAVLSALLILALVGGSGASGTFAFLANRAEVETRKLLANSYADAGRLAAQRGAWRDALVQFDKALGSGFPDSLDLQIGKIRCWMAVNDEGRARDQLASVLKRHDLGDRQGEVLLLQADLGQARVLNTADREALILRALSAGLPAAEDAYARGLIAPSTPKAADYFREALRMDPLARGAANRLGFLLILSGRHLEARELIAMSLLLFPDDPSPKVQRSVLAAFEGDLATADRMLDEAQPQISVPVAKVFRQANRLVARVHDLEDLSEEFARQNIPGSGLVGIWLSLSSDLIPLNRSMAALGATPMSTFDLPPYLANWQSRMTSAVAKLPFQGNGPFLTELEAILKVHPEGTFWLIYGLFLGAEKRFDEAEAALIRAAETPAAFKCRRMALLNAIRVESLLLKRGNPAPELRNRSLKNVKDFLAEGEIRPWQAIPLISVAVHVGRPDLAGYLVAEWLTKSPNDLNAHIISALVYQKCGAHVRAIEEANFVLARQPLNAEAKKIRDESTKALVAEANKIR